MHAVDAWLQEARRDPLDADAAALLARSASPESKTRIVRSVARYRTVTIFSIFSTS